MGELDLRSPGTIYPVLKVLRRDGYIENAPDWTPGNKRYVLTDKGKEQIKIVMLNTGRRYFAHYVDPYVSSLIGELKSIIPIDSKEKVMFVTLYEHAPIRQWLTPINATYLHFFDKPADVYDLIICCMLGTLMSSGWRTDEFTAYFPVILKSLRPGGTLIVIENERTANIYVELFFKEIIGFSKPPGFSKEELRNLLKSYNLSVEDVLDRRGLLIGISTKPN